MVVYGKEIQLPEFYVEVKDVIYVYDTVTVGDVALDTLLIRKEEDRWVFVLRGMKAFLNELGLFFILPEGGEL